MIKGMVRFATLVLAGAIALAPAVVRADGPIPTRSGRTVVTETTCEILDGITFDRTTATITPRSAPILDAIAATLDGNPSIRVVEVRAFANDAPVRLRRGLALERARAVVGQLVKRGVASGRLRPVGIPRSQARDPSPEFLILERGP